MEFKSIEEEIAYHEGRLDAIRQFLFDTHVYTHVEREVLKIQELKTRKIMDELEIELNKE
jgi:hypothetical protein